MQKIKNWPSTALFIATTALMAIFIVPFLMTYRVGPLSSFYTESVAYICAMLVVLMVACMGYLRVKLPFVAWVLIVFAAYLLLQTQFLNLSMPSQVYLCIVILLSMALVSWGIRGLMTRLDGKTVFYAIACALVLGTLLQSAIMWLQFFQLESYFAGMVMRAKTISNIYGQLGQRNHLGHYMTWGVIASAYLLATRKIPAYWGWLLVVWLGLSLGLVGSRSITVYAVMVSALAFVAMFTQKQHRSQWVILLVAMLWVVLMQSMLSHLFDWFGLHFQSGLDRAVGAQAIDSSRQYEWKKAWLIFQAAPWFGHGFGSYSVQGFLMDIRPEFLARGHTNVLYAHSHNLVLQLLAETGIVGTAIVMFGMVVAGLKLLLQRSADYKIFIAAMLLVSVCHSLLEYPLWYVFFLLPFVILLTLGEKNVQLQAVHSWYHYRAWLGFVLAVFCLAEVTRMAVVYQDILVLSRQAKNETHEQKERKMLDLDAMAQQEFLLSYYIRSVLTRQLNATEEAYPVAWKVENAKATALYRPFGSQAFKWSLYQMRLGNTEEALKWSEYVWRYYPNLIPSYRRSIDAAPVFKPLAKPALDACLRYQAYNPKLVC